MKQRHVAVAITGASGAVYGVRVVEELLRGGARVSLVITAAGFEVLKTECGIDWSGDGDAILESLRSHFGVAPGEIDYYRQDDLLSPIASGSSPPDAMIVVPCSMGTLSRISCGNSGNLVERAADVMLKEGRPLLLVPRETPLNAIHLENMLKLARMGVKMIPAMPAFYHQPKTVADMVDFVVGKVLDSVGVENELFRRWGKP